ncbi:MAG: hypothetical protein ACXVA9_01450 [Bdellovibrionales bacterium]
MVEIKTFIKMSLPIMLFSCATALAENDGNGTLGKAVGNAQLTSGKAHENCDESDRHYKKSKEEYREAREHREESGEPNHEHMHRSYQEARKGAAAESQAQEFAREALQSINSANQQQNQFATNKELSQIDVQSLQKIANEQTPLSQEVHQIFAGYGYNIDAGNDKSLASAEVAVRVPQAAVEAAPMASRSPASIGNAAINTAGSNNSFGKTQPLNTGSSMNSQSVDGKTGLPNLNVSTDSASSIAGQDPLAAKRQAALDLQKALDRNRGLISKQLGLNSKSPAEQGPIRTKSEDIFQAVHLHYSSIREQGLFYESSAPSDSPGPSEKPPSYNRGL